MATVMSFQGVFKTDDSGKVVSFEPCAGADPSYKKIVRFDLPRDRNGAVDILDCGVSLITATALVLSMP